MTERCLLLGVLPPEPQALNSPPRKPIVRRKRNPPQLHLSIALGIDPGDAARSARHRDSRPPILSDS